MTRVCFLLAALVLAAAPASAQDRSESDRARMELALEGGLALGNESYFLGVADLRLYAPEGFGAVLRTGFGGAPFAFLTFFVEPGVAYRVDLFAEEDVGVQLAFAGGATLGRAETQEWRTLYGAWGGVHVDLWYRNFFVGLGAVGRYARAETDYRSMWEESAVELWSVTPMIRIGGDWGL